MISFARKIDALGGVHGGTTEEYNDGYCDALTAATEIAEYADGTIADLVETIERLLGGNGPTLAQWATDAETLLRRIRSRQA